MKMLAAVICLAVISCGPAGDSSTLLRLAAGEATTVDRTPAGGLDSFTLRGTEGQTLVLELNPCCPECIKTDPDRADKIRVILADAKQDEGLSSRLPSDELFWHWMNVLPQSGVYRIVIGRPSRKRYRLRVTLMDAHDPRLDPGISADRVSIGPDLLRPGKALTLKAYEPGSFCETDDNWPAYLGMEDYGFGIEIMRMDGLKKAWWGDPEELRELGYLESALSRNAVPATPPLNTDKEVRLYYWGKPRLIETKSLRALRWVAEYTNGDGPLENPLEYMVQAVTHNGRHFLQIRREVQYLNPPTELTNPSQEQLRRLDVPNLFDVFQRRVNAALTSADPDSFRPSLRKLDTAVRSLELR